MGIQQMSSRIKITPSLSAVFKMYRQINSCRLTIINIKQVQFYFIYYLKVYH